MAAEAWVMPLSRMAKWVRQDEYHQCFNFGYLESPWKAPALKQVIDDSIEEFGSVGAPSTWVLSNHDVIRHATRFAYEQVPKQGDGIGPNYPQPNIPLGLQRARAATTLMLALPGGAYIYQGEELGLPEHTTIDGNFRQDPTYFRTKGERVGRDGCRVPIPWEANSPAFGFNSTGESWLPQPDLYKSYARDLQEGVKGSTLELYKSLLANRKSFGLGLGDLKWVEKYCTENSLGYQNGDVLVIANFNGEPIELPAGEVLVSTQTDMAARVLEKNQAVWIKL
jgi:alpha-glucosidase